jgi:hypothetical protein
MVELVNPYDTSRPVSEEKMFFGRDNVLAWVRENLIGSRRVFVLHGPRRRLHPHIPGPAKYEAKGPVWPALAGGR